MKHANTVHIGITPRRMRDQHFDSADMTRRRLPKKHPKAQPAKDYEPGYFTALVRRRNWPPMYQPHLTDAEVTKAAQDKVRSVISTATAEAGKGHAGRDMGLPGSLRNGGVKTMMVTA